jgi:hypothetical protein
VIHLALLALLASRASAQEAYGSRAIGLAGAITPDGRDWDFTTPGPYATTWTPVLSETAQWQHLWIGADLVPFEQHSYRRLNVRAPLVALTTTGVGIGLGGGHELGVGIATNLVTVGAGLRYHFEKGGPTNAWLTGFDVRATVFTGTDPDFQLQVTTRIRRDKIGGHGPLAPSQPEVPEPAPVEPGGTLDEPVGGSIPAEPEPDEAPPVDDLYDPGSPIRVTAGFETGTPIGLRARVGLPAAGLSVRVGVLTSLRRDLAAQPVILGDVDVAVIGDGLAVVLGGGAVRQGSAWQPVGDAAVLIGTNQKFEAGILIGPVVRAPDVGLVWLW